MPTRFADNSLHEVFVTVFFVYIFIRHSWEIKLKSVKYLKLLKAKTADENSIIDFSSQISSFSFSNRM